MREKVMTNINDMTQRPAGKETDKKAQKKLTRREEENDF